MGLKSSFSSILVHCQVCLLTFLKLLHNIKGTATQVFTPQFFSPENNLFWAPEIELKLLRFLWKFRWEIRRLSIIFFKFKFVLLEACTNFSINRLTPWSLRVDKTVANSDSWNYWGEKSRDALSFCFHPP